MGLTFPSQGGVALQWSVKKECHFPWLKSTGLMLTIWESNPAHWWQARVSQILLFLQILLKDGFGFKNNKIWAFYQFAVILQATATSDTVSMCMDFANDHSLVITASVVETTHQKWTIQYIIWSSQIGMYHPLKGIKNHSNIYLQNMQSVCTSIAESIMEINTLWASQQLSPL